MALDSSKNPMEIKSIVPCQIFKESGVRIQEPFSSVESFKGAVSRFLGVEEARV